jgi:GNAT superfamily N-acetyltransferase
MADEMPRWKVRDGNEKDLKGILSLRKIVFGEMEKDKLGEGFWRWEFMEGPDGKAFIYIVEDGNKIIGHFADIPRRFSVEGRAVLGTLSLDLMVHPDYWRRGIFAAMGRYGAQRVKRENGLFMTAFPIRLETILGLKKIGWKGMVELPVLVYPIRFSGIVNRYFHFLPLSILVGGVARFFYTFFLKARRRDEFRGIEVEEIQQLDDQFEPFWRKALSLNPIMGTRDQNYMTWRYVQHPTRTYTIFRATQNGEMGGFIVLRKVDLLEFNSAVIVDLLALDRNFLMALVDKGIEQGQKQGVDLLGFMVPKVHPYYRILRGSGFLPSFKTFLFMVYSHTEEKNLFDPKGWYVNWGDTDVI